MDSSRMRTVRCSSRLLGGGGFCPGGCLLRERGVCPEGGCLPRGGLLKEGWCLLRGCLPRGCLPRGECLPPPGQNSWHTLLKILPWSNFVPGGNKRRNSFSLWLWVFGLQFSSDRHSWFYQNCAHRSKRLGFAYRSCTCTIRRGIARIWCPV